MAANNVMSLRDALQRSEAADGVNALRDRSLCLNFMRVLTTMCFRIFNMDDLAMQNIERSDRIAKGKTYPTPGKADNRRNKYVYADMDELSAPDLSRDRLPGISERGRLGQSAELVKARPRSGGRSSTQVERDPVLSRIDSYISYFSDDPLIKASYRNAAPRELYPNAASTSRAGLGPSRLSPDARAGAPRDVVPFSHTDYFPAVAKAPLGPSALDLLRSKMQDDMQALQKQHEVELKRLHESHGSLAAELEKLKSRPPPGPTEQVVVVRVQNSGFAPQECDDHRSERARPPTPPPPKPVEPVLLLEWPDEAFNFEQPDFRVGPTLEMGSVLSKMGVRELFTLDFCFEASCDTHN